MFTPKHDPAITQTLQTYETWGGVMYFCLTHPTPAADPMNPAAHQQMAVFTMRQLHGQRHAEGWDISLDETPLRQTEPLRLSVEQFFGFCFDPRTRWLRVRGDHAQFLNYYFYPDEPQNEQTAKNYYGTLVTSTLAQSFPERLAAHRIIEQQPPYRKLDFSAKSYTDAFLDPPYGFGIYHNPATNGLSRLGGKEKADFFLRTTALLFGDLRSLFICEHSVDCSDFFDEGKEWWGSYLWTVYSPMHGHWVGIAASATD